MRSSPITSRVPANSFVRLAAWLAATLLVLVALVWPQMAHAQVVSPRCPTPFALSVAHSGSGTVNANACHEGFGIGFLTQSPLHGTVSIDTLASTVTYTHNGNSATSDTFRFDDGSGFYVQVNVAIGPASSITIAPVSLPAMTAGTPFSQALAASGGTGPYSYAVTAGTLPTGLNLSTGGVLSGTPTQRGSFSFSVTATDSTAATGTKSYTPTVAGGTLSITPNPPPNAVISVPYSTTFTPSGGVAPMALMWEPNPSFPLPPGLTLSGNTLSGTPTATGSYTFGIRITDASTGPGSWFQVVNVTMTVAPPPTITVNPATVANGTVGTAYSQTLTGSGGTAPYTFAVTAGALPAGVTLATNGTLSGTPTAAGVFNFTARATDNNGFNGTRAYSFTMAPPTIAVAPTTVPGGTVGVAYSQTATASGGTAPYSYAITAGALPPGLTLASNGTISGTPSASGIFNFTVTATDSTTGTGSPFQGSRAYSLTIATPTITVSPTTLTSAAVGSAYNQAITASGGTGPYGFAVTAGALPAGLTLASNGTLSGTPTAGGTFNFTVTATDGFSSTGSRAYALIVSPAAVAIAPTTLPDAQVASAYSQTLTASGGTASYSFSVTAGALPTGMSLSAGGVLSGTPTSGGSFNFTVTALDSSTGTGPYSGSRAYSLNVAAPTVVLAPPTLPGGTLASAYSQAITASGGTAPYGYAVTAGALPPGMMLASGGTLSGTPTTTGTFNFTVTATDSSGGSGPYSGSQAYTLAIADIAPIANPVSATVAFNSTSNPIALNITGGTPASVAVATAPTNGVASASGTSITYTPTSGFAGSDSFTYTATNSAGTSAPATVTITVATPTVSVSPTGPLGAMIGNAFSQTFTFSGGTAPYGGISVTGMPAGLSVTGSDANSVTVSGTPTQAGNFTVIVSATDSSTGSGPFSVSQNVDLTVLAPALTLTPAGPFNTNLGAAFSQAITAGGGTAPFSYTVTAGSLPPGMSLNAGTGILSGASTTGGVFAFTITATDSSTGTGAPFSIARSFSMTVTAAITVSPTTLPDGTAGVAYAQTISASGGVAPYGFSLLAGALPTGMSFTSAGALAGTPIVAGTFNFTVRATDTNGLFGDQSYTLVVAAPTIVVSPSTLPGAVAGTAYSQAISAGGGAGPYSYSLLAGSLPAGVSFSSAGVLSGTPTVDGTYNFTVRASDANGFTGDQAYSLVVTAPTVILAPATLPGTVAGTAYSQTISASGGTGPYSYSLLAGSLPIGVSFSSAGVLSGTPTVDGTYNFTVRASDANGFTGEQAYSLVVTAPTVTLTPSVLPDGSAGSAYSQTLSASGGTGPYSYSLLAGSLPVGVSFSSAGVLSGTPTVDGTYNFTVRASDANGYTGDQAYTLAIVAPTIVIAPASLPDGDLGVAYSQTITASGGNGPYAYSLLSGALPAGLSFSSAGVLSGTPAIGGSYSITVRATDAFGFTADQAYTLVIAAPSIVIAPATLADGTAGTAYSQGLSASGGTGPYAFSLVSGALPAGMSLSSAGVLSGTPQEANSFSFTVRATDNLGVTGDQAYTLVIAAPTVVLTPAALADGVGGTAYSETLSASGGTAPYTFSVVAGALPAGMSLASGGELSGTPTAVGIFNFTVRATDNLGFSGEQAYTLAIASPTLAITPDSLPDGLAGSAYHQSLAGTGGTAPYTFSLASGALPSGLTLSSSGVIAGTPGGGGTFTFFIRVTDAAGFLTDQEFTLFVETPVVTLTPDTLADGVAGQAYSQVLSAGGGVAPYAFSVPVGALPAGLTLASDGTLAGTPTAAGTFNFEIRAMDVNGFHGEQAYVLTIAPPAIVVTPAALQGGVVGTAYSQSLSASGGSAPYAFAVSAGTLPAGLTLDAAGTLSGTPAAAGNFAFDVSATDSLGFIGTASYSITVSEAAPVAMADSASTDAGTAVSIPVTANDTGVIATVAVASAPANGTASVSGLSVVYTPATGFSGTDSFTYTATGPGGTSNIASVTVDVRALPVPVGVAQTVTTLAGQAVSFDAAAGATGSPFTGVTLLAVPADGVVAVSGTTITYAPTVDASGAVSIGYTLDNAFGSSSPITSTVNINPLPVGAAHNASTTAGVAVQVLLTQGASGGPFTGADVVSVSPAGAGTTLVTAGGPPEAPQYTLTFTPAEGFTGAAVVSYTLDNAFATSATAAVTIQVTQRPDPTQDAEVMGLLGAQNTAARRFAKGQIDNFQSRMESLHDDGGQGLANGLTVAIAQRCHDGRVQRPGEACADEPLALPGANAAAPGPEAPVASRSNAPFGVWTSGGMSFGDYDLRGSNGFEFETSAITAGMDYRFSPSFVLGAGLGYGRDVTDVGENGTRSKATARSFAVYGSHEPAQDFFIDLLLGYQDLSFDARRHVTATGGQVTGDRDGDQWFGSLVSTYEHRETAYTLAPYLRVDVARATLDAFTEQGDPLYALHYGEQDVDTTTGNLGVRMEFHNELSWGVLSPMFRVEYQHEFEEPGAATLNYADMLGGPFYRTRLQGLDSRRLLLGFGAVLRTDSDWLFKAEYRALLGDNQDEQSIRLDVEKEF